MDNGSVPRLPLLILLFAVFAGGCGSGQTSGGESRSAQLSRSDTNTSDAVKLVVTWQGKASQLGRSTEWYQPKSGYYHTTHTSGEGSLETVFGDDGITALTDQGLYQATGSRRYFAQATAIPNIFITPGVALTHLYLHPEHKQAGVRFTSEDGGHTFKVVWRYQGDTSSIDLHGTITVAERVSAEEADRRGLFDPLDGHPVGGSAQRNPGVHPEHGTGYWFGDRLGTARAATELESWGADPLTGSRSEQDVRTIYRMDVSELPGGVPPLYTENYPGMGDQATTDISVDCVPMPDGYVPGQLASTPAQTVTISGGNRATLYVSPYTQADATGTDATFITDDGTACLVHGLITPDQLTAAVTSYTKL
jgi:hypothetical protein